MAKIKSENIKLIIDYLTLNPFVSSKEIYDNTLASKTSYITLQRILKDLIDMNYVTAIGLGKGTKYAVDIAHQIIYEIDTELYFKKEIDERIIRKNFNHDIIKNILNKITIFSDREIEFLNEYQNKFQLRVIQLSQREYMTEMEKLAIDLSWKSSQIEGNTYSLLETERLLKNKETAAGKTKDEAVMLLNHKKALDFLIENSSYVKPLTVRVIEDVHKILVAELDIDKNLRKRNIGISGTNYRPIDNEFQIKEALEEMCGLINLKENVFEKALLTLLLISYIQPFADGNKRTARIISNAILMNANFCPISFRTVDSIEYKKAMLIFYEQNNISAFKRIFIDQFVFATETYF